MKLQSLDITNFRSIRNLQLLCKPGINVIAGVNGAGKSTLLSAIELMLSWVMARIRLRTANGYYPKVSDIAHGENFASIIATASEPEAFAWEVIKVSPTFRGKDRQKSDLTKLTDFADFIAQRFYENPNSASVPMFVKYSVNRSLVDIPMHVHKKHVLDAMSLYEGKIDGGSNLRSFYEWFREREDIEREEREERHTFEYEDSQLKAVRQSISKVMEGYGELHTRRKAPAGFELRKNGEVFRVDELSDGEKCYLTLIGDIARRLVICNPTLVNPLQGEGIVLIDELELHLHPSWQSEAIDKLRDVFPNCQFFITTHSPHIVQNLNLNHDDSLTVLAHGTVFNVSAEYGAPVDEVLTEIFGLQSLRPQPVAQAIRNIWKLLNEGIYESQELNESIEQLSSLIAEHDMEFAKIRMQIALNRKKHSHAAD